MQLDRRRMLQLGAASVLGAGLMPLDGCSRPTARHQADHVIRIGETTLELAPGVTVRTTAYNGQFPGPLLRLREGQSVIVDIHNDTARPEQLHWHGQKVPV